MAGSVGGCQVWVGSLGGQDDVCRQAGCSDSGVVKFEVILAGGDQLAVDCEGGKILQTYRAENRQGISFWEMPAVKRSVELGQGVASEEEIRVIRV